MRRPPISNSDHTGTLCVLPAASRRPGRYGTSDRHQHGHQRAVARHPPGAHRLASPRSCAKRGLNPVVPGRSVHVVSIGVAFIIILLLLEVLSHGSTATGKVELISASPGGPRPAALALLFALPRYARPA